MGIKIKSIGALMLAGAFSVSLFGLNVVNAAFMPPPTLTSISPTQTTVPATFTLNGTNFQGAVIDIYNASGTLVTVPPYTSIATDGSSLTFSLSSVFMGMVGAGTYSVKVVTGSGGNGGTSNAETFTVVAPASTALTVSSMTPTSATPGATINVAGTNFDNTTYISIDNGAWTLTPTVYAMGTTLSFVLPSNIAAGSHTVQIGNKGSTYAAVNAGTITIPATTSVISPSITILSPNGGETYSAGQNVPITFSTNLTDQQDPQGVTIQLYKGLAGSGTFAQTIVNNWEGGSPYNWQMPSNITPGQYSVYISALVPNMNLKEGGVSAQSNGTFTIVAPPTTLSASFNSFSASPTSITSGQMTTLSWSGAGISQVNLTVTCPSGMSSPDGHGGDACGRTSEAPASTNSTQLLLTNTTGNSQQVTIAASAYDANNVPLGKLYAYVTVMPATQTQAQAPTVSSMTPTNAAPGATINISGSGYDNTTYVSIDNGAWTLTPSVYALGTTLSFVLPSNIAAGSHTVQIGNKGSTYAAVNAGTIVVTAPTTSSASATTSTDSTTDTSSTSGSDSSYQALQQQLVQLMTLLLQLLEQASAKGLLTTSQLNAALGTISH